MKVIGPIRWQTKWGFLNESGVFCIPPVFDALGDFREGLASVLANGRIGFLDDQGKFVIRPQFEPERFQMPHFTEGLAPVRAGGRVGYINTSGTWAVRPSFARAWDFRQGHAIVEICAPDQGYYVINSGGQMLRELCVCEIPGWQDWPTDWDCFPVQQVKGNRILVQWINIRGATVFPALYPRMTNWVNGVAGFCTQDDSVTNPWGLTSISGEVLVHPKFWCLGDFSEGLARGADSKDRIGFINPRGDWVIEPVFIQASPFREGLACVSVGRGTGFINTAGAFVIEPVFSGEGGFKGGYAQLKLKEKHVVIDRLGEVIWSE